MGVILMGGENFRTYSKDLQIRQEFQGLFKRTWLNRLNQISLPAKISNEIRRERF